MTDSEQPSKKRPTAKRPEAAPRPGPARLLALLAGIGLALLGVLGFFYDSTFGTGSQLASDDLAGILFVNGWSNVVYLASGILALALAPRFPRLTALGIGAFYLVLGLWGLSETNRGIGSILDAIPLGDNDNALHLIIGGTGLIAALVDGPLPSLPERRRRKPGKPAPAAAKPAKPAKAAEPTSGSGGPRRSRATPRSGGGGAPR